MGPAESTIVLFQSCGTNSPVKLCTLTYLVDAYTIYAASAVAASTVFRSLFGAILPLAGNKMYASLGMFVSVFLPGSYHRSEFEGYSDSTIDRK